MTFQAGEDKLQKLVNAVDGSFKVLLTYTCCFRHIA
jgi:hypothetical protein